LGSTQSLEQDVRRIPATRLWELRTTARRSLIEYARERLTRQLAASGRPADMVEGAKHLFDPQVLTMGFARRFATYKRPNLLLHDPDRLLRLLTNRQRPVQLLVAGKAHPADRLGQALIQEWMRFISRPEARAHVIFLSDHDMRLAGRLVQGVDVWINTPRRPWEACGTSGMKVLVNGGLNLSELDGWWAEAYEPDLGWALGDGKEHADESSWDAAEAEALYDRLEREVVPEFYSRNENGIPTAWVARMRESMARLTPRFCSSRTVREYTEQYYIPAAAKYLERAADGGSLGAQVVKWQHALEQKWAALRFGEVKVETDQQQHIFRVQVYLSDLNPDAVRLELYADPIDGSGPARKEMMRVRQHEAAAGGYAYSAAVPATRPAGDYTPRVVAACGGVTVPLEGPWILWQR
jgi:starch phosphorylase